MATLLLGIASSKQYRGSDKIGIILDESRKVIDVSFYDYAKQILTMLIMDEEINASKEFNGNNKDRIRNLVSMYNSGIISYFYSIIFSRLDAPSVSLSWVSGFFICYVAVEGIIDSCVVTDCTSNRHDHKNKTHSINRSLENDSKNFSSYISEHKALYQLSGLRDNYAHGRLEDFDNGSSTRRVGKVL
jgi:hypothetical protein